MVDCQVSYISNVCAWGILFWGTVIPIRCSGLFCKRCHHYSRIECIDHHRTTIDICGHLKSDISALKDSNFQSVKLHIPEIDNFDKYLSD